METETLLVWMRENGTFVGSVVLVFVVIWLVSIYRLRQERKDQADKRKREP